MTIHFKESLIASLAAFGLVAAVGVTNAQNASAKSRVRVTSNVKLRTDATTRNVNFTGRAGLYTKASAFKSAKKVATTITLKDLARTNKSAKNVRAYRVAKTNKGKVYYKVVTFDGRYRGWIYGGRSTANFAGGLKSYQTFQEGSLTNDMTTGTFQFANPGTANDNQTVTYKQPAWTQYKVGRQVTDSTPYANVTYKIDKAGTRTREGDQWVHIYATNGNSGADGWILYSGLKTASNNNSPVADNAIRINVVDSATGASVTSVDYTKSGASKGATVGTNNNGTWQLSSTDSSAIQTQLASKLGPLGYTGFTLTQGQMAAIAQATFGSDVTISVVKPTIGKAVRILLTDPNGNTISYVDYTNANAVQGQTVGTLNGSTWQLAATDASAIQTKLVDALKGTGYALSASNTLTADQQAAIAQTTYGNQVSIKTVAVNPVKDNEVQLSFVDQSGNAVGSLKLTKGTNDKKAIDTIKAASKDDPTSSDAATVKKAYAELLTAAGIKGYTTDGLTSEQAAANLAAITKAEYGKDVKLIVAKIPVKALASKFSFFDQAWEVITTKDVPVTYFESSNGKRDSDTNFSKALVADANLNGYAGDTVSVAKFN
ncbi:surface layer protein SlpB [Lentilactobacillus sunkii]|nr:surface layer protein SlpB [Lentilactobacillus sunkii]